MIKKFLLLIVLVLLVFIIGCGEDISDEQLNDELDELSDNDFILVLEESEETSLVGEAKRNPTLKKVFRLKKLIKRPRKLPLICVDNGEQITFIRGTWNRSIPKFFCSGDNSRERICNAPPRDGYTSKLTICEDGCDNGVCIDLLVPTIITLEGGRIRIEHNNFIHTTFSDFEDEGLLEIVWLEACYNKLQPILGIEPISSERIELNVIVGTPIFYSHSDETGILITKIVEEVGDLEYYYNLNEETRACENEYGEARTTVHELTHGFSSRRHPFQEGLAQWGMFKTSDPGYEEIICQEEGFTRHRPLGNPTSEWGFQDEFYEYSSYGDYSNNFVYRQTEYCFWKEIESQYGEATVREIIQEGIEQDYLPPFVSEEGWDLMLREFLTEIVIPNTDESFKDILIEKFGLVEENFIPVS
jgi:hypothetical protein